MGNTQVRDPAELVQAAASPAPSAVFSLFRRNDDGSKTEYKIRLQMLRRDDTMRVLADAQREAEKWGEDPKRYGDIYTEAQAKHLIAHTLCRVEGPEVRDDGTKFWRRLFVSPDHVGTAFTENEIAYLINLYEVLKAKYSAFEEFEPKTLDEWAVKLSDEVLGTYFLSQLDFMRLPELVTHLARRVCELSESLSLPLPSLQEFLGSERTSSTDATTGSTGSPTGSLTGSDVPIPNDHLISSQEARAIAEEDRRKAAKFKAKAAGKEPKE